MSEKQIDKEKANALQIYAAFGAALVLSFVPTMFAAFLSTALGLGVLIAAYVVRKQNDAGSLSENHMTFIIRTIWIGSFFALITMTAGSIYLFLNLDNAPLEPCFSGLLSAAGSITDMASLKASFGSCYEPYWFLNKGTFITGGVIAAAPILVYFLVRYARGLSRAMNGYRVAKPLAWF